MSKRKTVKELRDQADELMRQADALELERAIRIGKLIIKAEAENFEGITLESLIKEITKIN